MRKRYRVCPTRWDAPILAYYAECARRGALWFSDPRIAWDKAFSMDGVTVRDMDAPGFPIVDRDGNPVEGSTC